MPRQSGTLASQMRRSRLWRLAALVLLFATLVGVSRWQQRRSKAEPQRPAGVTEADARAFLALERKEQEAERTVWAGEIDAQRHEDVFLALWDTLNRALEPLSVLAQFSFEGLRIGGTNAVQELQHGIRRITFRDAAPETFVKHLDPAEWRRALDAWRAEGWQLGRTRWQETRFTPATLQHAAKSVIGSSAQLSNESRGMRAILRGDLEVEWKSDGVATAVPVPRIIAARRIAWRHPEGGLGWNNREDPSPNSRFKSGSAQSPLYWFAELSRYNGISQWRRDNILWLFLDHCFCRTTSSFGH